MKSLAVQLFDTPLALLPARARLLDQLLRTGSEAAFLGEDMPMRPRRDKSYECVAGVAVICVHGILMHGDGYCWWGITYYGQVRKALAEAYGDPEVKAIALHVDSPGGTVNGLFDLADVIYAMRGTKPIWAIVDEVACSAGYLLASAADRVVVPRTGMTGSIGIVALHLDITKAMEDQGVTVTTIQYGARKSDGYPTTKLTTPALKKMQADIDTLGEMFVADVARNRGLKPQAIRDTEAETYLGKDGMQVGLADAVMSPDRAFLALVEAIA